MKRISIFLLFVTAISVFSCEDCIDCECLECEIYNEYHNFVEYYGPECGDSYDLNSFIDETNDYAWDNYAGYAECYKQE